LVFCAVLLELSIRESLFLAEVEIVCGVAAVRIDKEGKMVAKFYVYITGVVLLKPPPCLLIQPAPLMGSPWWASSREGHINQKLSDAA
jgi:hypothetical protein